MFLKVGKDYLNLAAVAHVRLGRRASDGELLATVHTLAAAASDPPGAGGAASLVFAGEAARALQTALEALAVNGTAEPLWAA